MQQKNNHYLTGWQYQLTYSRALFQAWQIALQIYPTMSDAWKAVHGLLKNSRTRSRFRRLKKAVVVGGRVYSSVTRPGFPSAGMDTLFKNELNRIVPIEGFTKGLLLLMMAITKKCPMRCEHCFEWEALNHREALSLDDLTSIIRRFQERGLSTVHLSGGEPLNRFNDLLELLRKSDTVQTDFWISTSGYLLDPNRARLLKEAGLTGVIVSLDHWDSAGHDRFRGMPGAFEWAMKAARNARDAGLVVSLAVVATRSFCTPENLWRYMEMAKSLQVHFVRILEPRAVGHFAMLDEAVELDEKHWTVISDFHTDIQSKTVYRDYPIVEYQGDFQRKAGCGGGGDRYLYIDTDGDFHACPFCRHKCGSAVNGSIDEGLTLLKKSGGCHAYHLAQ